MWLFQGYSIRKITDEFNSNPEYVKKYNKERRLKNDTIKMVDSENPEDVIAKKRGYLSVVDSNKKDDKENTQVREMSETLSEEQSSQEMQGD